ncbi:MAG TPA: AAA family ATPase [Nitrosopumilaceae archaeon]|nr:AAA family ATPase [Nitrosopumilaceae archaeon]
MQLESFEIKNFRSIKHVKCVLSPQITILAGKNEAGKTTILQALEALNDDWQFKETDKPQHIENDGKFELKCTFKISEDEKFLWLSKFTKDFTIKSNEVIIKRSNKEPTYVVTGNFVDAALKIISEPLVNINNVRNKMLELNQLLASNAIPHSLNNVDKFELESIPIQNRINEINGIMTWINANNPLASITVNPTINALIKNLNDLGDVLKKEQNFIEMVSQFLPRVVLFSSFNDVLPAEIQYTEFTNKEALRQNHRIVDDLAKLSGIDREKLVSSDNQTRANLTNKASRITSDAFGDHWNQNPIEISFRIDGSNVLFFIQDKGKDVLYRPEQRSKGLQWYIAFFLRLTAEDDQKRIFLIDEPGLYLHAKAQLDVLGLLEKLSENNQIIFSTHSPYLIDPTKLGRLRLVTNSVDSDNITINNFNTRADLETLTPIITAIGLDITKGLNFPNKRNIVIEGVSDYYYLQTMLYYLKNEGYKFPDDVVFIPCVGNVNVGTVASLLHGYGLNYKILLDRKGTAKTRNSLIRDGVRDEKIIQVGKTNTDSIEDLFDPKDKKNYDLLNTESSKAIVSRNFYDKIVSKKEKNELSSDTIENFKKLFDEIKKIE